MGPRELPIAFCGEMVRAIYEGCKTMTRRVIKPQPDHNCTEKIVYRQRCHGWTYEFANEIDVADGAWDCPLWQPRYNVGDRLWVKEIWFCATGAVRDGLDVVYYRSTDDRPEFAGLWKSPRFMFKWAARLWLEVTAVKAERLQDISEEDAIAEGIETVDGKPCRVGDYVAQWKNYDRKESASYWNSPIDSFHSLWDSLNAKRGHGWDLNEWVFAYTFKRIECTK